MHHVPVDGLDEPDAGVEAVLDDVDEGVVHAYVDVDPRVLDGEPREQIPEHELDGARRDAEPDAPRDLPRPGRHRAQGLERLLDGGAGVAREAVAGLGERHAARRPHEERRPEPLLELPHGLAERRGGRPEVPRRAGEAPPPGDREERGEGVQRGEGHGALSGGGT